MAIAKRKKKFFDVEIPIIGKETQVLAYDLKELDKTNLSYDLSRILKGKNILLKTEISVTENKAVANPKEIRLLPFFIRKTMRKGISYIEDSFSVESKDARGTIKPFLITRKKVSRKIRDSLRKKTKETIIDYVKEKESEEIFRDILRSILQKRLGAVLKKIYPLSMSEIRIFKIEKK